MIYTTSDKCFCSEIVHYLTETASSQLGNSKSVSDISLLQKYLSRIETDDISMHVHILNQYISKK